MIKNKLKIPLIINLIFLGSVSIISETRAMLPENEEDQEINFRSVPIIVGETRATLPENEKDKEKINHLLIKKEKYIYKISIYSKQLDEVEDLLKQLNLTNANTSDEIDGSEEARWQVNQCYRDYLGRDAEPGGLIGWSAYLRSHGLESVKDGIAGSKEARLKVNQCYRNYLGRDAEPDERDAGSGGLIWWLAHLRSYGLESVKDGIAGSEEARRQVNQYYRDYLGRDAEPDGLIELLAHLRSHGLESVKDKIAKIKEEEVLSYELMEAKSLESPTTIETRM